MEKYYSAQEISELCGLHIKTVQRFIREGRLGAVKVGREWRVTGDALSRFMEGEKDLFDPDETIGAGSSGTAAYAHIDLKADFSRASSISNSIIAALNSLGQGTGVRFEFAYYEKERHGRFIFRGDVSSVAAMLQLFNGLEEHDIQK